jgi:hypothetical protein
MSQSIPVVENAAQKPAKDSSEASTGKQQNSRVVMATALMTALTTIGVSFIGIVPQLRRQDTDTIKELRQEFNLLREKSNASANTTPAVPYKKISIHGTVRSEDGTRPLNGVEVYLMPEGDNLLTAKTDDSGVFNFTQIPSGTYSIIIRDSAHGKSGKGLLDEDGDEIRVIGAKIKYRIRQ